MKKTYTHFLKPLLMFAIMALLSKQIFAQSAPNISYSGAQTYMVGKAINPLSPTNTGGAVPATIYGQVTTFAGNSSAAYADGTGTSASFYTPNAVATDAAGNVYVADEGNDRIRKITPDGVVTTLAGSGNTIYLDGTGTAASFKGPVGVAADAAGNVYVADAKDNRIRKISAAGVVTTLAGSGKAAFADQTGALAYFYSPHGVATDAAGNVYVADASNNRIRKVSPDGLVTTLAGNNNAAYLDGSGAAASFNVPAGVATDVIGNVYVADKNNNRIRKISPTGVVTTLAGNSTAGYADGSGTAASFNHPVGIATDAVGNVYVADQGNNLIRKISPAGVVTTLAGSGNTDYADGTGTGASFNFLAGVATDAVGNIYAADASNNRIRKISFTGYSINAPLPPGLIFDATTGTISGIPTAFFKATTYTITAYNLGGSSTTTLNLTVNLPPPPQIKYSGAQSYTLNTPITSLSPTNTGGAVPLSIFGNVTTLAGNGKSDYLDGQGAAASFRRPSGVATDKYGNVYVSDAGNSLIRKINPMGYVTTFAGGNGSSASFSLPSGITMDAMGSLYSADESDAVVRKIDPLGNVTTLAGSIRSFGSTNGKGTLASFDTPEGIAVDAKGNVYVVDEFNNLIRKIDPAGNVTTFAGNNALGYLNGNGTAASFSYPAGIAIDAAGNLYITDQSNSVIRKIDPLGNVTTLAGSGTPASINGKGIAASFYNPTGIAVDAAGNVYVGELGNNLIRKIDPDGNVTTLAGIRSNGSNDGPGSAASFNSPVGLATDVMGNVYVADQDNNRIRKISTTGYSISPQLPAGLNFDATTGTISGTPISLSPATNYTITAYNIAGSSSATLNLTVNLPQPPVISYNSPQSYPVGSAITPLIPSSSGLATPGYINIPFIITYKIDRPYGLVNDASGNLYFFDVVVVNNGRSFNNILVKIPAGGDTPVIIGTGYQNPKGLAIDSAGNIYFCDLLKSKAAIYKIPAGGGSQVTIYTGEGLKNPVSMDIDRMGNIFVADLANNAIKEIPAVSSQPIVVGSGFKAPTCVAVDASGNVYVNDQGNRVIKKIPVKGGSPITIGTGFISPNKLAVDAIGNVFVSDLTSTGGTISEILVGGNPTVICSGLSDPQDLRIDSLGQIYVFDIGDASIKKVFYAGYHINPALPSGLTFDTLTGTISGTPTLYSSATNYTITARNLGGSGSASLSLAVINPAPVITFNQLNNVVYGVADITPGATSSQAGIITYTSSNTNVATITSNGNIHVVGVGTTNITASTTANSTSAAVTPVTQPLTVTQAPLTITATNQTMVYGGTLPNLTYTATGFVNGDDLTKLTSPVISNTTASGTTPSGSYPITVSGATATNYSITFVPGTLTINQAALTITADNQTKYYGDDNPTLTYTFSGFVNNEDASVLTTAASITANATAASTAGTYPITVLGAAALNYAITFVPGTLTINTAPAPTITLIDNTTATTGNTIHLTGTYFLGATAVNFGGTAAASFTINSATSITAVVGNGASGSITVTTPSGTGTLAGFNFVPIPTLTASGSTTILSDGAGVTLTANPMSGGYTYQWQNNGVNISGATKASYTTTQSGNYTVIITLNSVSQTSAATTVTSVFDLTANNYHLTVTGETCNGSSNGTVAITADASLNYTAVLSGNGISTITQKFSSTTTFNNLPAGSYTLTFTVDGQTSYSKAYTVTVTQPQPLSVFATVNEAAGNIELNLSGGSVYHIQLNNKTYTTTESSFSVPLEQGNNALQVSTDRECQGIFTKLINPSFNISPYPMPFESTLNLNLGSSNVATVSVRIYSTNTGLQVFTADYQNQSGVLQLDLSKLAKGAYGMQLIINNTKKEFKIIK